VVFLYKIVASFPYRSLDIRVAQLAGMPAPVIQRAIEIMNELEKTTGMP
jgi:DNA mismatch repair protein MutS